MNLLSIQSHVAYGHVGNAAAVFGVLKQTADAGARELLLIAAQQELIAPSRVFAAEALGISR